MLARERCATACNVHVLLPVSITHVRTCRLMPCSQIHQVVKGLRKGQTRSMHGRLREQLSECKESLGHLRTYAAKTATAIEVRGSCADLFTPPP